MTYAVSVSCTLPLQHFGIGKFQPKNCLDEDFQANHKKLTCFLLLFLSVLKALARPYKDESLWLGRGGRLCARWGCWDASSSDLILRRASPGCMEGVRLRDDAIMSRNLSNDERRGDPREWVCTTPYVGSLAAGLGPLSPYNFSLSCWM